MNKTILFYKAYISAFRNNYKNLKLSYDRDVFFYSYLDHIGLLHYYDIIDEEYYLHIINEIYSIRKEVEQCFYGSN